MIKLLFLINYVFLFLQLLYDSCSLWTVQRQCDPPTLIVPPNVSGGRSSEHVSGLPFRHRDDKMTN